MKGYQFLLLSTVIICKLPFAQNVGIGTTTPQGKLHIKGAANVSQLIIDANSAQTNTSPLIKLRKSDGTDLMWIHSNDSSNIFIGVQSGRLDDAGLSGTYNTFIGSRAGYSNVSGNYNTANGAYSLYSNGGGYANTANGAYALFKNNIGINNTAIGANALYSNIAGIRNTAVGTNALYFNTEGINNTANGYAALHENKTASQNTAIGTSALYAQSFNNGGIEWQSGNTAVGFETLYFNNPTSISNGVSNTAIGHSALRANTTGWDNTAVGVTALYSNITGQENTATGRQALFSNTEGYRNTATGYKALRSNGAGSSNTAFGVNALFSNSSGVANAAFGGNALYSNTTGSYNTALGVGSDVSTYNLENATAIGTGAVVNASNKMQLGNTITSAIATTGGYTIASDGRFKENLQGDVKGLDFIMKLRPYTYNFSYTRYDAFIQPDAVVSAIELGAEKENNIYQQQRAEERSKYKLQLAARDAKRESGFIAQDVEKAVAESGYTAFNGVYPPTNSKDNYSLDYSKLVVPLVKSVQEQQAFIEKLTRQVEQSEIPTIVGKQQVTIEEQNKKIDLQQQQINMLLKELQLIKNKLK